MSRVVSAFARICLGLCLGSSFLFVSARPLLAANCAIVHHEAPTDAELAYRNGEFAKAESLYSAALSKAPERIDAAIGLVHSLLKQQRIIEASESVHRLLEGRPAVASLLTLRAEVELRQGEPWSATETATAALKLDQCNPRTLLIFARLADLNSRHLTARWPWSGCARCRCRSCP